MTKIALFEQNCLRVWLMLCTMMLVNKVSIAQSQNGHEYVDLGLPSGTLWATCNVGATKPEEYGDYFAWGETVPKDEYSWKTYKWEEYVVNNDGTYKVVIKKYNNNNMYGNTDNKSELDLDDDAAYANWGNNWRMPSIEQIRELRNYCDWEWIQLNGVYGNKYIGPNKNYVFLPAAGHYGSVLEDANILGLYWSRTIGDDPRPGYAYRNCVNYAGGDLTDVDRWKGYSVRPVTVKSDQPTDYLLGDANGDGKVTVADYTAIAHYIMGNATANFNEKAADVNGDGKINVADYTAAAHLILYGTVEKPK